MSIKNKKGFTLIELVAVLVILAIIALIVTPLVMSIIRKAKIAADKRSVDAYGRSIELAIAEYLMDTGDFPTSINQLTIEYSGDEVSCNTILIGDGGKVYLADCKVNNRTVEGYTYGDKSLAPEISYNIGSTVVYNNEEYYVLSGSNENRLRLLKSEPLTTEDLEKYLQDLDINQVVGDVNGIGKMKYGSIASYENSDVKKVVDAWARENINESDYVSSSLITLDELVNNFAFQDNSTSTPSGTIIRYAKSSSTVGWSYNYEYWLSSSVQDSDSEVYYVSIEGGITPRNISNNAYCVRPVIEINKSSRIKNKSDYKIGDIVFIGSDKYYVLKDSNENELNVTLLKARPLTIDEVNLYGGVGTANNRVNKYTFNNQGIAGDYHGYGQIAYYSSETCGYVNNNLVESGCKTDYDASDIKYVVDAWVEAKAPEASEARLITVNDLVDDLGMEFSQVNPTTFTVIQTEDTPMWVFDYRYWTSSILTDQTNDIRLIGNSSIGTSDVYDTSSTVRPVIVFPKSAL